MRRADHARFAHAPSDIDQEKLVTALSTLAADIAPAVDRRWFRQAAVRVIDCVLSLNRNYKDFVVPRLDNFEREHPNISSIVELQQLIISFPSAATFLSTVLNYHHPQRAAILHRLVDWLATMAGSGSHADQRSNLRRWAENVRPSDSTVLRIRGFGLKGFQYLRMLFGANAVLPDVHMRRWVEACTGKKVSDSRAVKLLKKAAQDAGVHLQDFDPIIWERAARASS